MRLQFANALGEPMGSMIARAFHPHLDHLERIRDAVLVRLEIVPSLKTAKVDERLGILPKFTMFFSLRDEQGGYCDIPKVRAQTLTGAFYQHDDGRRTASIDWRMHYDAADEPGLDTMLQEYAQEVLRILTDDMLPTTH